LFAHLDRRLADRHRAEAVGEKALEELVANRPAPGDELVAPPGDAAPEDQVVQGVGELLVHPGDVSAPERTLSRGGPDRGGRGARPRLSGTDASETSRPSAGGRDGAARRQGPATTSPRASTTTSAGRSLLPGSGPRGRAGLRRRASPVRPGRTRCRAASTGSRLRRARRPATRGAGSPRACASRRAPPGSRRRESAGRRTAP